ncbi:hypothetical protein ES707_21669 [subsurface metagenome]
MYNKRDLLIRLMPLAFIALFIVPPFVLNEYKLGMLVLILIYIVVAQSFRLMATTGEFSFAHVAIMGIGGYTSALLARYFGLSFWVTLPIGGLAGAAFAAITAYPLFRMKGFYFFIGSFAIGEAVRLSWWRWRYPFGGPTGLTYIPAPTVGTFTFDTTFSYYFLVLGIVGVCMFVMYRIDRSQLADYFKAIRSADFLSESVGMNVLRYKTIAYITASFFASIAGVLLTHYMGSVNPAQFGLGIMLHVLVWVIVGGVNNFWGPIVGVMLLRSIEDGLRGAFEAWVPLIYGVILISVLFALPDGLESLPRRITDWRRIRRR